jgi:hypothetical protein
MQPGARTADLTGDEGERDQAARVVGAKGVLGNAHAPEDDGRRHARTRATVRRTSASMPQIKAISSGVKSLTFSASAAKPSV